MGTAAQNGLTAVVWNRGIVPADCAALAVLFRDGKVPRTAAGAFQQNGQLFIPGRGWLNLLPGDVVGVDANGWPIMLSKTAFAGGAWVTGGGGGGADTQAPTTPTGLVATPL